MDGKRATDGSPENLMEIIKEVLQACDFAIKRPKMRPSRLVPELYVQEPQKSRYLCPRCRNDLTIPHAHAVTCDECNLVVTVHGNRMEISGPPLGDTPQPEVA